MTYLSSPVASDSNVYLYMPEINVYVAIIFELLFMSKSHPLINGAQMP